MASMNYLIFVLFSLVACFTPGPAVMLAIHNAMHHGWRNAFLSSLGNISGLLVLTSLSALGADAVLRTSTLAFDAIKIAGAVYLSWLGLQQWRSAKRFELAAAATMPGPDARPKVQPGSLYARGLGVALTNPKAIAFIAALFPQFVSASRPIIPQYVVLTATFMSISLLALSTYAAFAAATRKRLGAWFASGWPQRASALAFCAFGIGLLRLQR